MSNADLQLSQKLQALAEGLDDVLGEQYGSRVGFVLILAPFNQLPTSLFTRRTDGLPIPPLRGPVLRLPCAHRLVPHGLRQAHAGERRDDEAYGRRTPARPVAAQVALRDVPGSGSVQEDAQMIDGPKVPTDDRSR